MCEREREREITSQEKNVHPAINKVKLFRKQVISVLKVSGLLFQLSEKKQK